MELDNLNKNLKAIQNNLSLENIEIELYLFGSILINPRTANDIDILIVYHYKSQLHNLKKELRLLSIAYPLHIIYFTREEEQELNFIQDQKARKVINL